MRRTLADGLEFGEPAAQRAAEELVRDGWMVKRLDQLPVVDGRGPRILGSDLPFPDLEATKRGRAVAVEVKRKSGATWGRLSQQLEHGIDRRAYDGYCDYQRRTGLPTFVVIVEPAGVFAARITELGVRHSAIDGTPMVFWPRSQMSSDWLTRLNRCITQSDWSRAREERRRNQPPQTLWDAQ
jgi:hypothetical protein